MNFNTNFKVSFICDVLILVNDSNDESIAMGNRIVLRVPSFMHLEITFLLFSFRMLSTCTTDRNPVLCKLQCFMSPVLIKYPYISYETFWFHIILEGKFQVYLNINNKY